MKYINKNWLEPLALGSAFMGAGGGGSANNLILLCQELFTDETTIPLLDIDDLKSDKMYAAVGLVGSSEVVDDFYCNGQESINALNKLSTIVDSKFEGIFTLECAGINVLYSLIVSLISDIPLIDGDCIGRAFPELQMNTFHLNKESLEPFIFSSTKNKLYEFYNIDNFLLELNVRQKLNEVDNIGFFATCPTKGNELQRFLIPNTLTLCYEIGKVFAKYSNYNDILINLVKTTKNSIYGASIELFIGKVNDIKNIEHKHWKSIRIRGLKNYKGENFQILTQNENLIGYKNNSLAIMVPDLISIIDMDTLKPINNDTISPGMNIAVIGTPAPLIWKTNDALNIVGPHCFGYKSPYRSLEELYYNYYY